jgi:hypothetical protein
MSGFNFGYLVNNYERLLPKNLKYSIVLKEIAISAEWRNKQLFIAVCKNDILKNIS